VKGSSSVKSLVASSMLSATDLTAARRAQRYGGEYGSGAQSSTTLAVTQQQVEQSQQAVDAAQAQLDATNATLEVARLNLERPTVVAPVNGIVTNFALLPGRYVNAGAAVFAIGKIRWW
jgi:multidrug resistance efflux pump